MYNTNKYKVYNDINMTNLEYINIYGLFGRFNALIPISQEVNIFIGENGLGKTTILNCIYYILNKDMVKLSEINFKEIHVKFRNEEFEHNFTISDVNVYLDKLRIGRRLYNQDMIEHFVDEIKYTSNSSLNYDDNNMEYIIHKFASQADLPYYIAQKEIINFLNSGDKKNTKYNRKGDKSKIDKLFISINQNIEEKILYLPTYRRIEDDFEKLKIDGEKFKNRDVLIRFGMADVQNLIDNTLEKIRKEAIDGFTKMTGVLLKQYSINEIKPYYFTNNIIDGDALKIALNRIGDKIDLDDKERIMELYSSGILYEPQFNYLYDLLLKLIENYQLQKKYDDKIKNFVATCNKYLNGKQFIYNESELSLEIEIDSIYSNSDNTIKLRDLSSGEKQIISLFSKLYLDGENKNIVIIDEPELSLSIQWQSMLLPDIMRSKNCSLLLTVTHSPFIFENEFDMDAKEMRCLINYYDF